MAGDFVWYDLQTSETAGSKRFYTGLLGWTTETDPMAAGMDYAMWKSNGQGIGGVMPLEEEAKRMGAQPAWIVYISVPNADAAVQKCQSLGGRVHVPATDIPNTGRFAIVADPQGAAFAVFEPHGTQPGDWKDPCGWHEIATSDVDAGWRFYEQMFGWRKTSAMEMPSGGVYQMFAGSKGDIGGMMKKSDQSPSSAWVSYFSCRDARAVYAEAMKQGVTSIYAPMQVPGGGWAALIVDPQGAVVGLVS
jgi:predicted enzyme related to lactoylglutathione lyase